MRIAALRLANVRNYVEAEFLPADGVTIVYGANGAGKSNLLEAAGLFATLSSPRAGNLGVLVRRGEPEAGIRLEGDTGTSLEIRLRGGRALLRAGAAPTVAKAFLGRFTAVLFTPEDLDLVRGEPDLRRRALDDLIVQMRPAYRGVRRDYDRALRQRNAALRSARPDDAVSYDRPLAETGAQILEARRDLLDDLSPLAASLYDDLSSKRRLSLRYRDTAKDGGLRGPALVEFLLDRYADGLGVDLDAGTTRVGPHRDDVEIGIDDAPVRSFASRGEQRCAALAFRLAQLRMLGGGVLLLDDVLSELDPDRRGRLFKAVGNDVQTIVATADRDAVPPCVDVAAEWVVSDGLLHARG